MASSPSTAQSKSLVFELWRSLCGLLLIAAIAASLPAAAASSDKVARFDCDNGVCGFNVTAADLRVAPCKGLPVLVAYSQNGGATLIQCSTPGGVSGLLSYLFDRRSAAGPAFELAGTRFIKPDFLVQAAESGIPDRFGSVPLCVPARSTSVARGELLLVVKTAGQRVDGGDCYRLLRVSNEAAGLEIDSAEGQPPAPTTAAGAKWRALVRLLLPFVQNSGSASSPPTPP